MSFKPIQKLMVTRTLSSGEQISVGVLAFKRFDYVTQQTNLNSNRSSGRLHMHSACGLLDADFRTPNLDYIDLIKASRQLC